MVCILLFYPFKTFLSFPFLRFPSVCPSFFSSNLSSFPSSFLPCFLLCFLSSFLPSFPPSVLLLNPRLVASFLSTFSPCFLAFRFLCLIFLSFHYFLLFSLSFFLLSSFLLRFRILAFSLRCSFARFLASLVQYFRTFFLHCFLPCFLASVLPSLLVCFISDDFVSIDFLFSVSRCSLPRGLPYLGSRNNQCDESYLPPRIQLDNSQKRRCIIKACEANYTK